MDRSILRAVLCVGVLALAACAGEAPPEIGTDIGLRAPAFELTDSDGHVASLADYADQSVVLIFYRGHW